MSMSLSLSGGGLLMQGYVRYDLAGGIDNNKRIISYTLGDTIMVRSLKYSIPLLSLLQWPSMWL